MMAMENVLYRRRGRSLHNPRTHSAQAAACRASDVDFSDVFGGPPRCLSAELRRSLGDGFHGGSEDAVVPPARFTCPWAAASAPSGEQLPVFGEESPSRRKHLAVDFFDDIFNGVDSNLMPARRSSDVSRHTASPVHPSLNNTESPLLRQQSLSNLAKKLDSLVSDATHTSNLKRVTNTSPWPSYHTHSELQTHMQRNGTTLDGSVSQLETEEAGKETSKADEQFHFSIYKWPNNGIPLNVASREGYGRGSSKSTGSAAHVMKDEESPSGNFFREESGGQETGSAIDSSIGAAETYLKMSSRNNGGNADFGESIPTESVVSNEPKHDTFINSEKQTKAVNQGRVEEGIIRDSENGLAVDELLDQEKRNEKNLESSENERMLPPKDIPVVAEEMAGSKVKGKVQQFVKLFSNEAPPKPKHNKDTKPPKLKRNSSGRSKVEEKSNDAKVNQPFKEPQRPSFSHRRDSFGKSFDIAVELIEVEDIIEPGQNVETNYQEEIHMLDTKIRKWSSGKEGNIRSLLSTLQYVLWAESGWKPVALVDIIEGGSVKRAYQKALLCLHPDKLQQKGATSQQKYIAEKVFDILQDAWTHFNLISSL